MTHYKLDKQIGFVLRKVMQRHASIFSSQMPNNLTSTQFAVMAKLLELGTCSQNKLGRHVVMDAATIKGVIDRLAKRGLVKTAADLNDRRRLVVDLTTEGEALIKSVLPNALEITNKSLEPLSDDESKLLIKLLNKLA